MPVFARALVLGVVVAICAPGSAAGASIVLGNGAVSGTGCSFATESLSNCSLFSLADFDPTGVTGSLDFDNEVALFEFSFSVDTLFSVTTSSWKDNQFDPTLGLFYQGGELDGRIVTQENADGSETAARSTELDFLGFPGDLDEQLEFTLAAGTYLLAVMQYPNDFPGVLGQELLQSGFTCDAPGACEFLDDPDNPRGNGFSFAVTTQEVNPAPVPEPGTLTLMAGGALAGLWQRRRAKRRTRSE